VPQHVLQCGESNENGNDPYPPALGVFASTFARYTVFPPFPQPLEIAAAIPTLHTATTTRENISQNP
jgi:hypothetical protein